MRRDRTHDGAGTEPRLRPRALGIVALLTAIAGGVLGIFRWQAWRAERPEYAVRAFDACAQRGDAGCLYKLMGTVEKESGLTRPAFERFFREIYLPRLRGFRPGPTLEIESGVDADVQSAGVREYRDASGRAVFLGPIGGRTEGPAIAECGVATLLLPIFQTYRDPRREEPTSVYWLRAIESLKPALERAGLRGAYLNQGVEGHFVTWDDWMAQLRAHLEQGQTTN